MPRARTKRELLSILQEFVSLIDNIPLQERIRLGLYSLRCMDEACDALAYAKRVDLIKHAEDLISEVHDQEKEDDNDPS